MEPWNARCQYLVTFDVDVDELSGACGFSAKFFPPNFVVGSADGSLGSLGSASSLSD
jgi:hypothetical protein